MSPHLKNRKKEGRKEKKVWRRDVYQMNIRDPIPTASRKEKSPEGKKTQRCRSRLLTVRPKLEKLNSLSK